MFSSDARELLGQSVTGVLTTLSPGGYPQSTAVWFLFEDDVIKVSMTTDRKKYRNMVTSPKVTFFVLNPENHWSYVEIRGDVTWEPDQGRVTMLRIGEKYSTDVSGFDPAGATRITAIITPALVNAR